MFRIWINVQILRTSRFKNVQIYDKCLDILKIFRLKKFIFEKCSDFSKKYSNFENFSDIF